jgi:hypothetical protein
MINTDLVPFVELFPEQAIAETRTITTRGHTVLPDDEYALVESFCPDPTCDCRRVMLNVLARHHTTRHYLASISFGFDRDGEMAGPFLDPLNPQSRYARALLEIVQRMLETDAAYVARLESHYQQVKVAVADPAHPVHKTLEEIDKASERRMKRPRRRRRGRR